ncbi:MAG TPA: undecaprenyldiphospho-muramoylpentapeptide beta-N-acetylglucosaminyltransferase [Chitinophagales bacterium]|nr:undecaprenyldiphospho-muramoylpentapeptide beta-N-acetylglucosaminyltransferase [Chitinophagales bacterium]
MKAIISGGGTGGHIFPAIAIANALKKKDPSAEILFVGANGRMEMEKVPQAGYEIKGLNIAGFQRGSIIKNLTLPFKLAGSMLSSVNIVRQFKPDVAIGVGGYASGPLLRAASLLGVPTVIQEQNSFAGVTNKILARNAKVICTAYEGMEKVFPKDKIVLTGNPVRAEIVDAFTTSARQDYKGETAREYFRLDMHKPVVLILGGSLGAKTINKSVEASLERIKQSDVQVLWQTGKMYIDECERIAANVPNLHARMFIDRMDYAYACADVIISRAGALSISELQIVGKPVILVPSPNVAEDHQTHNAMALVNKHAAIMIKDDEARLNLIGAAYDLLENTKLKAELSENIKKMAIADAAGRIVNEIYKVVKA